MVHEEDYENHELISGHDWKRRPYREYLNSQDWADFRAMAIAAAGGQCAGTLCSVRHGLQPHHLHYRTLGRERLEDVQVLCRRCHARVHGIDRHDPGRFPSLSRKARNGSDNKTFPLHIGRAGSAGRNGGNGQLLLGTEFHRMQRVRFAYWRQNAYLTRHEPHKQCVGLMGIGGSTFWWGDGPKPDSEHEKWLKEGSPHREPERWISEICPTFHLVHKTLACKEHPSRFGSWDSLPDNAKWTFEGFLACGCELTSVNPRLCGVTPEEASVVCRCIAA